MRREWVIEGKTISDMSITIDNLYKAAKERTDMAELLVGIAEEEVERRAALYSEYCKRISSRKLSEREIENLLAHGLPHAFGPYYHFPNTEISSLLFWDGYKNLYEIERDNVPSAEEEECIQRGIKIIARYDVGVNNETTFTVVS